MTSFSDVDMTLCYFIWLLCWPIDLYSFVDHCSDSITEWPSLPPSLFVPWLMEQIWNIMMINSLLWSFWPHMGGRLVGRPWWRQVHYTFATDSDAFYSMIYLMEIVSLTTILLLFIHVICWHSLMIDKWYSIHSVLLGIYKPSDILSVHWHLIHYIPLWSYCLHFCAFLTWLFILP